MTANELLDRLRAILRIDVRQRGWRTTLEVERDKCLEDEQVAQMKKLERRKAKP